MKIQISMVRHQPTGAELEDVVAPAREYLSCCGHASSCGPESATQRLGPVLEVSIVPQHTADDHLRMVVYDSSHTDSIVEMVDNVSIGAIEGGS